MRTPPGGLRPALIFLLAVSAMSFASPPAHAATRPVLHVGSASSRVCGLKWMLSGPHGHRPNVFTVQGTFTGPLHPYCDYFGRWLGQAIVAYKYRLGYPSKLVKPVAGPYLFALLQGTRHRPILWVALAQRRAHPLVPGPTREAARLKTLALSQLGVHEIPDGSNRGPRISFPVGGVPSYQSSTGAYGAAWCASFVQWLLRRTGYGVIANGSAGVLYIEGHEKRRGNVTALAKVGSLVAYLDDGGHIGLVTKITASGYVEISGNTGNAVRESWHPWGYRLRVFVALPGVA